VLREARLPQKVLFRVQKMRVLIDFETFSVRFLGEPKAKSFEGGWGVSAVCV